MKESGISADGTSTLKQKQPLSWAIIIKRIMAGTFFVCWFSATIAVITSDDTFTLITGVSAAAVLIACIGKMILTPRHPPIARAMASRWIIAATLMCCIAMMYIVIITQAALIVRTSVVYHVLFLSVGISQLGLAMLLSDFYGVGAQADAVDRANTPAAIAVAGTMIGFALAYAGANVGEGATIWTTLGPAALVWGALAMLWMAVAWCTEISDAIAINRDDASAFRLAGMLSACGLVLGRAVAGDYVSAVGTLMDALRAGWPIVIFALATILMQRAWKPSVARPMPNVWRLGVLPAVLMQLITAGWLIKIGAPR